MQSWCTYMPNLSYCHVLHLLQDAVVGKNMADLPSLSTSIPILSPPAHLLTQSYRPPLGLMPTEELVDATNVWKQRNCSEEIPEGVTMKKQNY